MSDASDDAPDPGPQKPRPVRAGGPVPARSSTGAGEGSRPTPVREAMEARREERQPLDPPSLRVEIGGEEWIVRAEGRTTTGGVAEAGAPLLLLTFARASEPERRLRECLAVSRRLETLGPEQLAVLFDDARPFDAAWEGSELFPETRKSRKSGR